MGTTILVIEDNEQNLYMITFLLEKHGYNVIQARTGRDGITLACRELPEMILLDIQIPEMDGYAVARELRSHPETVRIPIVMVTSYAMAGDREKGIAAGGNGYIEKPINPETFVTEIEKYLPEKRRNQEEPDEDTRCR